MDEEIIINWDVVLVLIEIFNTLIIVIPATFTFLYYKFKKINMIVSSNENGSTIVIQNVSKNAIFVKEITLFFRKRKTMKYTTISLNENSDILELTPNSTYKLKIDYLKYGIKEFEKKKIKITLNNRLKYTRRIKNANID